MANNAYQTKPRDEPGYFDGIMFNDAPVMLFAYPNGKPGRDYGPRDVELVKEAGFDAAMSTIGGVADHRSDLFQLPRFSPWDGSPRRFGLRLLVNCLRGVRD